MNYGASTPGAPAEIHELKGVDELQNKYIRLLKQCGRLKSLSDGKRLHHRIQESRLGNDLLVGSQLIRMYLECGNLDAARVAFDGMDKQDPKSWNAAIATFARYGHHTAALQTYQKMAELGNVSPNDITLVTVLKVLVQSPGEESLRFARAIHARVAWSRSKKNSRMDSCVAAALMNFYGKCGCLLEAETLFSEMEFKDRVSWSTMIAAYVQNGRNMAAGDLFRRMLHSGMKPNEVVFVNILNALTGPEDLEEGKLFHSMVIQSGLHTKVILATALISMYGRFGCPEEAFRVFRGTHPKDVVVWNAMIGAYAQNSEMKNAMRVFKWLISGKKTGSITPTRATFLTVLSGVNDREALAEGRMIHEEIQRRGYETNVAVVTALMTMYGKCGALKEARVLFEAFKGRNLITWNAMMSALLQNREDEEALLLFHKMLLEGIPPSSITLVSAIDACANLTEISEGLKLHKLVDESGYGADHFVVTALVDMFGKCGNIGQAERLFNSMNEKKRDVVVWSALVAAHSQHGDRLLALKTFHRMQQSGVRPGHVAFLSVLSACRHSGLLDEACLYFSSIVADHGLQITVEQQGCMVDLLARAGWLSQAEDLASRIPGGGDSYTWVTLLDACKTHGDLERGKRAGEKAVDLDPENSVAYLMLAQILAADGKIEEAEEVRRLMVERGLAHSK